MAVLDKVDRALDRLDGFDDWVRDRLPQRWVKTVPAPPPRADDKSRRGDTTFVVMLLLRFLVPTGFLAGWLLLRGEWWAGLLGALVIFIAASVAVILVREIHRRT
jgi:hypothetical protein